MTQTLAARSEDIDFIKVKGHSTIGMVEADQVRFEDKRGNDAADTLAVEGAGQHDFPPELPQLFKDSKSLAVKILACMTDILIENARINKEKTKEAAGADPPPPPDDAPPPPDPTLYPAIQMAPRGRPSISNPTYPKGWAAD
jgi:hypothetical protein